MKIANETKNIPTVGLPKLLLLETEVVGETRYALSEVSYVSPGAVGYSSCAVAFWG